MRLISKHQDYYDYIAKNPTMSDQSYIWKRKPKEVKVNFAIPRSIHTGSIERHYSDGIWFYGTHAISFVVWFCGRAIPMMKIIYENKPDEYVSSIDDFPPELQKDWGEIRKSKFKNHYNDIMNVFDLAEKPWTATNVDIIKLDGGVAPSKIDVNEMHRQVGSPVFCTCNLNECLGGDSHPGCFNIGSYNRPYVIANPILSAINFHKVIDAFSAFKEIERFLTNEMAPRDFRMDQPVSDKINAESHGFDKFSFRKESTKKT